MERAGHIAASLGFSSKNVSRLPLCHAPFGKNALRRKQHISMETARFDCASRQIQAAHAAQIKLDGAIWMT